MAEQVTPFMDENIPSRISPRGPGRTGRRNGGRCQLAISVFETPLTATETVHSEFAMEQYRRYEMPCGSTICMHM
eukprot:scaffold1587_cov157-Cylindrotheca_fusiformis.AAC.2